MSKELDDRERDENGRIRAVNGSKHLTTIREEYGEDILPGRHGNMKLDNLLEELGLESQNDLLRREGKK